MDDQQALFATEEIENDERPPQLEDLPEDEDKDKEDSILLKSDYHQIWFRPSLVGAAEFEEYPRHNPSTPTEQPPLFKITIHFLEDSPAPMHTFELRGDDRALMNEAMRQLTIKLASLHHSGPPGVYPDHMVEAFKKMLSQQPAKQLK